jgi:hypothetical protein
VKLYYDVTEHIQRYLVTRDSQSLHEAIGLLALERRDPTLQESILTLDNISAKQAEMTIAKEGYLRISTSEITNSGHVEQDKYIRVVDKTGIDEKTGEINGTTAIVLKVGLITDEFLLLVPYTPGGDTDGTID